MPVDRINDWKRFSRKVLAHVKGYTIPQYETKEGDDQVERFTSRDCVQNIKRYINRFDTNVRGESETLRDLLKVAHYSQFAYDKFKAEHNLEDVYLEDHD